MPEGFEDGDDGGNLFGSFLCLPAETGGQGLGGLADLGTMWMLSRRVVVLAWIAQARRGEAGDAEMGRGRDNQVGIFMPVMELRTVNQNIAD